MKVIECLSEDIEVTLDLAEENIKKAITYQMENPIAAKAFYIKSVALMDSIKNEHDAVVALIEGYRKEKGEPPVPMMSVYNYIHKRHMEQAAAIKSLQDTYSK